MHPLDTLDRRGMVKDEFKIGLCNITKCCTEVCPESIHITDNGIIPLKERVADDYFDPVRWLVGKAAGSWSLSCSPVKAHRQPSRRNAWTTLGTQWYKWRTRLGKLGLLGVAIPEEYGGAGMDALSYALAMEEVSAACASCGVIMSVNNSLFCDPVYKFGTDEQKKRVLVPVASGSKLGCFGLTEPMSGSDAQTMVTGAEKTSGGFVLNGAKNWISNGPEADWILVFAITDRSGAKVKHTAFLVERGTPGYSQNAPDHKLGIHAAHSCTVFFENCKVPDQNVLGGAGNGFKVAMATLDGGRIGIACQAIGIARAALRVAGP
ncbi:MAG: acyl-CoA dehydrogenase family protein [Polyangiaceae bacterium]